MKLSLFIAKNLYLGCTGRPIFDDHTAEVFKKGIERNLMTCDDAKAFEQENICWYYLGTYDDEDMVFDILKEPLLLVRCSDILSDRKIKARLIEEALKKEKEVVEDGKDDK